MPMKRFESANRPWRGAHGVLAMVFLLTVGMVSPGHAAPRQAPINGEVQLVSIDNAADPWSGGRLIVGGQSVIIPKNFIFDLPANRLTLAQLYADAPGTCTTTGETGLAKGDRCNRSGSGAIAAILADILDSGNVIAGQVSLEKAAESVIGNVTYIDHTNGYLRVNGVPGDPATGAMVRINDPTGRFTLQQGPGCLPASPNCSADVRYGVDSDNYTVHFTTGYPACLPSTVTGGLRTAGSDANGVGDPFCPVTNRTVNNGIPVQNSFRFAPIRVGDSIAAEGNFETINGVQFLSAHTLRVNVNLTTAPGQPDYMVFEEVAWDVAGFQNRRIRMLLIGATTLPDSQLDVFAIHFDRTNGQTHEFPIGSTFNNPSTINQGLAPNAGHLFRIRYDVDFLAGTDPELSPCINIANAGLTPGCPGGGNLFIDQNFAIINPPSRDIIGRTRNKAAFGIGNSVDIQGAPAFNGRYLNPVTLAHPDFAEINAGAFATPFIFTGIPWNLDRRLGPGGCGAGPCEPTDPANPFKYALNPFPFDGLDPRTQAGTPPGVLPSFPGVPANVANKILSYYPFGPSNVFPWDNTTLIPPAQAIAPTPVVTALHGVPILDFDGDGKIDIAVWRPSTGIWFIVRSSDGGVTQISWGISGDMPVTGDYDGDGKTDVAVYRPSSGVWFIIRSSDDGITQMSWGISGDVPVPGDYDGDGKTDFATYRPSSNVWHILRSSDGEVMQVQWGIPGDVLL